MAENGQERGFERKGQDSRSSVSSKNLEWDREKFKKSDMAPNLASKTSNLTHFI